MSDWIARLLELLAAGIPVVRLAVATVRGSAPREPGATMLFWRDAQGRTRSRGTIGGGHLEARALEIAGHLLSPDAAPRRLERFALGASLGQCCGGAVELYWERFDDLSQASALASAALSQTDPAAPALLRYCALDGSGREWLLADAQPPATALPPAAFAGRAGLLRDGETRYFAERLADDATPLWLYGAGHVGRALVRALADLPFRLTWVDSRVPTLAEALSEALERRPTRAPTALYVDDPEDAAALAPDGACHLVMTHSHEQDLRICETLLKADRFAFLGLIGSRTKAARFAHRLRQKGCAEAAVARMICPIGVGGIASKWPAAIAAGVAVQLLQQREQAALGARRASAHPPRQGVQS